VLLETLERPARRFGADAIRKRDDVLRGSLAAAWADMEQLQGADPKRWQWGKLHFSYFVHPMTPILDSASRALVNVGPLPRGGGAYTVNVSAYQPDNFWQAHGASFRMVLDVGNWDDSRAINTPGQSGQPALPGSRGKLGGWAIFPPSVFPRCCGEGGPRNHRTGSGAPEVACTRQGLARYPRTLL
jgi:penicillin amidase